ncbi:MULTISPECIES: winged helix-turn-helix transcriptional regulator [Clostridium]|uniref:Winged helix-turn-helix transcriptional regulator n=1 Tax=Clostridium autoethanogenum DSM 10061 TaxID=1341692 RepID=A0ABY4TR60_9CLOT|nr:MULTISPECIES: winged helix-turn-helix transcriptional regulator [Clostridium]URS74479.1 winged helix-turn-helix transcriptional regulator [Clostridium autoethanogenum DSM 10061]
MVPPKTEYSLTELGKTFVSIVKSLCKWGEDYFKCNYSIIIKRNIL